MVTKKKAVTEEPLKINPIPPLQEIIQGISRITNTSASGSLNYNEDHHVIAQDGHKLRKEKKKSEIVTVKKNSDSTLFDNSEIDSELDEQKLQSKRKEINTKGNLSKKKETTPRTSPTPPTKTTIRSQTLIARIMATNYSIADQ